MNSFDSYLFSKQLPDNGTYRLLHNIVTSCTVLTFTFNYLIFYLSPPSNESLLYKASVHAQATLIFACCNTWSLLFKCIGHFQYNFYYCEGYFYLIGLTGVSSYIMICVFYGSYATSVMFSYVFRLYLLVDHKHFLRIPYVFPTIFVILEFMCGFTAAMAFYIGHSQFDPKRLPFNLTEEQLDFLISRSVTAYHLDGFRAVFYPVYFLFLLALAFIICVYCIVSIIHQVKKKQSFMSSGATKHHLKVLKVLTIQAVGNSTISCFVPVVMILSLFVDINPRTDYLVHGSVLIFGTNSLVQSVLTLYLNPVSKKTLRNLVAVRTTGLRIVAIQVESSYK